MFRVPNGGFVHLSHLSRKVTILLTNKQSAAFLAPPFKSSVRCMMARSDYQPSAPYQLVGLSVHRASGWTLPLVMSLEIFKFFEIL